jgi:hypothetical protein
MKEERESGLFVDIGHLGPMLPRKAIVEGPKESANLIFVSFGPRKNYDCFSKVEWRTDCRFIICQLIIFGDVLWELLSEEVPLQTLVHVGI